MVACWRIARGHRGGAERALSLSRGNAPAPTGQIEIASRLPCKLDDMRYTLGEAMHLFVVGAATGNTRPLTSAGAAE
jgi:hypothetical protein